MFTPILTEALFTIAKIWKQPVSTEGWMDKEDMIHTHTHTHTHTHYYSAIKKEWKLAIEDNLDGPREYYAKWNKADRERQITYDFTYMWILKTKQMKKYSKTETDP